MAEQCPEAAEFMAYIPGQVVMYVQLLFSVSSLIVNLFFVNHWRNNIFFHSNCRILLWTTIVANIVHALFIAILQGFHLFKIYTVVHPCNLMTSPVICFLLRLPPIVCLNGHITAHLSIVIERAIALRYLSTYESSTPVIAYVLVAFVMASSFSIAGYGMYKAGFDKPTFFCGGATKQSMFEVSLTCSLLVALEAVILALFFYVYYLNFKRSFVYDLPSKYQAKESLAALRLLIPLVAFHFAIFSFCMFAVATSYLVRVYFASDAAFRTYVDAIYIIPIYTFCSPLLLWWILRRHREERSRDLARMSLKINDVNDIYFANYAWNAK